MNTSELTKEILQAKIEQGLTGIQIASWLGISKSSLTYWYHKFSLVNPNREWSQRDGEQRFTCRRCHTVLYTSQMSDQNLVCSRCRAKTKKEPVTSKECPCGVVFTPVHKQQIYHTKKCRENQRSVRRPNRNREGNYKKLYGISLTEYDIMVEKQKNLCALCGNPPEGGGKLRLAVDHCHTSGKIRDLLCGKCNGGLGLFGDNIELLQKAIHYLEKHK